jgi:hypothetical protein
VYWWERQGGQAGLAIMGNNLRIDRVCNHGKKGRAGLGITEKQHRTTGLRYHCRCKPHTQTDLPSAAAVKPSAFWLQMLCCICPVCHMFSGSHHHTTQTLLGHWSPPGLCFMSRTSHTCHASTHHASIHTSCIHPCIHTSRMSCIHTS